MTAAKRTEDKALSAQEDKTLVGEDLTEPVSAKEVKAEAHAENKTDTVKVVYVHHYEDKIPGDEVELPADRATSAIAAGVARLAK